MLVIVDLYRALQIWLMEAPYDGNFAMWIWDREIFEWIVLLAIESIYIMKFRIEFS